MKKEKRKHKAQDNQNDFLDFPIFDYADRAGDNLKNSKIAEVDYAHFKSAEISQFRSRITSILGFRL